MIAPLIGINLYCFRDFCQTEPALEQTLGRLKAIGYPSVQVSGVGSLTPAAVKRLLDKHNLVACAAHDSFEALTQHSAEVIAKLKILGCSFTALGFPGEENLKPGRVPFLVESLLTAAKALAAEGLKLGYHNHAQEFAHYQGGPLLGWIYANSPANVLFAELDTAWAQLGGGSPAAWIRALAGRMPAVHLKDYRWLDGKPQLCEVGHGNLAWPDIFAALVDTGVPVWIVEQDDPVPERDIFESAALSLRFIREFLDR
jgi:sugar phosphate isomerase/epimerase